MAVSILDKLLVPERHHRRATSSGDFAIPGLQERPVDPNNGPFVATNMRGGLVQTRPSSREGYIRFGFSEVPLEDEEAFLVHAFSELLSLSAGYGWPNRCGTIREAFDRMASLGYEPRSLVIPYAVMKEECGIDLSPEEVAKLMFAKGCVSQFQGVNVLVANLPQGAALLTAAAALTGFYTRVDTWIGILLQRADRTLMLVCHDLA
jgi:hypothetical protein